MYLRQINIKNYACIDSLKLKPEFGRDGNPKPMILMGKNGTGKTITLMNILDSIQEIKHFKETNEYRENVLGNEMKNYIQAGKQYSYLNVIYKDEDKISEYLELNTEDKKVFLKDSNELSELRGIEKLKKKFVKDGFYRDINDETSSESLEDKLILYFPAIRHNQLDKSINQDINLGFNLYDDDSKRSKNSNIVINNIKELERWILDLIFDHYLYETKLVNRKIKQLDKKGKIRDIEILEHKGFEGKNNTTINLFNDLLTIMWKKKYKDLEYVRIGISKKEKRRVSIVVKEKGKEELQVVPTFSHLSSGEFMLISLFGEILKQYDLLNDGAKSLEEVKGIVLIDEIDVNLNMEYSKEILPELISAFKGVQFIITTHSPYFALGVKDHMEDNCDFIQMPTGNKIDDIEIFDNIRTGYNNFITKMDSLMKKNVKY